MSRTAELPEDLEDDGAVVRFVGVPGVHPLCCGGCGCKSLTDDGRGPCTRCGWQHGAVGLGRLEARWRAHGRRDFVLAPPAAPAPPVTAAPLALPGLEPVLSDCPERFVAIDFETGDTGRDSACAVAVVRVQGGRVTGQAARLIQPPRPISRLTTEVHGLRDRDVAGAPPFGPVWTELAPILNGAEALVAHNAAFDRSVLRACCAAAGLEMPSLRWICTVALAKKTWPEWKKVGLDVCAEKLQIPLQHHHALSDAQACAEVLLRAHGRQLVRGDAARRAPPPAGRGAP